MQLVTAQDGVIFATALQAQLGLKSDISISRLREHWQRKRLAEGNWVVSEALEIMQDHLDDTLTVGQIAKVMPVSPRGLERSFGEKI